MVRFRILGNCVTALVCIALKRKTGVKVAPKFQASEVGSPNILQISTAPRPLIATNTLVRLIIAG